MKKIKMRKVAVSGYFNPLHEGHINLLRDAKKLGDYLIVIINNDKQVKVKGSTPFMGEDERIKIVGAIRYVDEVFLSIDNDLSICKSLKKVNPDIFANGGDRHQGEVPEAKVCRELNIEMIDGVGGDKVQSSSELLKNVKSK